MLLNKISELSIKSNKSLRLYIPNCEEENYIALMLKTANVKCFSKEELQQYRDIIKNVTFSCNIFTSKVDTVDNNRELWEENNPECISRKEWEKIALKICNKYKIEVIAERIESACDIAFEITKNIIDCDVLTLISIQQKMCDLNIKVEANKNQCSIDYKLLVEKHPFCNLSLKEYITLIDSGYSFEILSGIYNKNLKLEVDSKGITTLVSPISKYKLPEDLKFTDIIIDNNGNLVLPKRILEDYNITNKLKKQILDEIHIIQN